MRARDARTAARAVAVGGGGMRVWQLTLVLELT